MRLLGRYKYVCVRARISHADNKQFDRDVVWWVETLVANLRGVLLQKLQHDQLDIWREPRLSSSEPFLDDIRDAVTQSATLLVLLSESYPTSEWCRRELDLFLQAAAQTGNATGRIVLVRLDNLDPNHWPAAFHRLRGHRFFEQANMDAATHILGTPAADDPDKRFYFQQLDDLSQDLADKLLALKEAPEEQAVQGPQPADNAPAVFLAEATPDFEDLRENIRRQLQQADIRVLPETHYDRTPQAFRAAMEADLDQSLLFVQLLGLYVTPRVSGLRTGYEGLQLDVSEAKGTPILRWHSPELDVASARDHELFARADIMVMDFEAFKREIINTVRKWEVEQTLPAIEGNDAHVLVNANSRDEQVAQMIQDTLDQQGFGSEMADENDNIDMLIELYVYHGLMVVYGQCEERWVRDQLRVYRQILLKQKQRAPLCAVYIGPPDDKPKLGIRLPNLHQVSYRDRPALIKFLDEVQTQAAQLMTTSSPYPGLRPFEQDEAHLFFGREAQIADMLARLEDHRFLAVIGTSGCGKSSLVRAGLIPALEQGFLFEAEPNWRMTLMRPGSAPFDHLTAELLQDAALGSERRNTPEAASLQAILRRGPLGLVEAVQESRLPEDTNLLLVVDQFEEIFRYRKQAANVNDADAFVNLLLASVQAGQSEAPIYVVITMRSDFIGDCALFPDLPEAVNDSQLLTPRLTRDQYRAAIVEPALADNGQLDESLVNRLLNDLRSEPDQLPVLQHALMRMWTQAIDEAPTRVLTVADYENVGGLTGALSKPCDEILYNDLDSAQQRIAEVMFRVLCERGSDQRDTRRPVQLHEVAAIAGVDVEAVRPVVDAFRGPGRNFLMPPQPTTLGADTTLDISHESLIRQWDTLNTWVTAEAESARQYQRLEDAAKRRQQGQGAELWRGVDLESARE